MAEAGKPRGLTAEQKSDARQSFESGRESLHAIARRLECRYATLQAIRSREGWTVSPTVPLDGRGEAGKLKSRIESNVVEFQSRQLRRQLEESGAMKQIVDKMASGTVLHAEIELELAEFARETLRKANAGQLRPGAITSEAAERKDVAATIKIALELGRLVAGKVAGMPSVEDDTLKKSGITIRRQRLQPEIIPVNEKGRIV